VDLRRAIQRHDRQMLATIDEVDLECELISWFPGNQRLWLCWSTDFFAGRVFPDVPSKLFFGAEI